MSKENVVLFTKAANRKPDMVEKLGKSTKTGDWVKLAKDAGFEFTAEEFRDVVAATISKKVTTDNAASEYLAARNAMPAGELDQKALDSVTGGMAPRLIVMPPMFIQASR